MTDYDVDKYGSIINPGKFEGECIFVPYYWDQYLNGCGDSRIDSQGVFVTLFEVIEDDREKFPDLEDIDYVLLWESENGFVFSDIYSKEDLPAEFRD